VQAGLGVGRGRRGDPPGVPERADPNGRYARDGPHDRRRTVQGRTGRLADRGPLPVRGEGAFAVGPRGVREAQGPRHRRLRHGQRRRVRAAHPRGRRPIRPTIRARSHRRVRRRGPRVRSGRAHRGGDRRPRRLRPLRQRMRSAQLLEVASRFPEFPVMIEAARECVQDDFDVPALTELMHAIRSRQVRLVDVETPAPSPFAKSLLFGYAAQFLYDGDTPLAERRATALTLDASLLSDVLGEAMEVADLLDPDAVASVEAEVGRFTYPVRGAEGLFEL